MGQAGGLKATNDAAPDGCPLTQYQLTVLQWAANGKSDAQVGAIMGTTEGMIQQHMHRIRDRMGAPSRTAAVATALRKGWIT